MRWMLWVILQSFRNWNIAKILRYRFVFEIGLYVHRRCGGGKSGGGRIACDAPVNAVGHGVLKPSVVEETCD